MIYTTYAELAEDIKNNLWKVPRDIDGIIAIERSGIIPATMISKYCNIRMTTYYSFVNSDNIKDCFSKGMGSFAKESKNSNKYLVVDDTICSGRQMRETINRLKQVHPEFDYITLVVYKDISNSKLFDIDIFFKERNSNLILSEWSFCSNTLPVNTLFDFDGVFVVDPPCDDNIEEYKRYLKSPNPKLNIVIANNRTPINICSYRIKKYYKETLDFLVKYGYKPGNIYMYNADTIEERNKVPSYVYKASVYKNPSYQLFVESNDYEAQMIARLTGKPVISIEGNKLYQL